MNADESTGTSPKEESMLPVNLLKDGKSPTKVLVTIVGPGKTFVPKDSLSASTIVAAFLNPVTGEIKFVLAQY